MASKFARASEHIKGIGKSLDAIAGTDVLLVDYTVGVRQMRGEDHDFVTLRISTDVEDASKAEDYHAWSGALGEKIAEIPKGALPVIANFTRVPTSSGFRTWTIT